MLLSTLGVCGFQSPSLASARHTMRATRFFVLLAVTLALLASTASQDTAGEPEGFDVDAQAVRDAAVYLTPEEKGVISVGNDILRGNDTIPDAIPDYGDDTVRTKHNRVFVSHVHVSRLEPGSRPPGVHKHTGIPSHLCNLQKTSDTKKTNCFPPIHAGVRRVRRSLARVPGRVALRFGDRGWLGGGSIGGGGMRTETSWGGSESARVRRAGVIT
jgi:hypothetical protein